MKGSKKSNVLENLAFVSQIGISMLAPILGGILLGNLLDNKLGTNVIFLIIFTILGVLSSFVTLYKITTRSTKRK